MSEPENTRTALITAETASLLPLGDIAERAQDYLRHAKAANTVRAYRSDWQHFLDWCERRGLEPLPSQPQAVALYLTDLAESCKTSTLQRRLTAISQAHQLAGYSSPTKDARVRAVWAGIRRTKGTAQKGKAAVMTDDVRLMVESLPSSLRGLRDRALLLVGFAGAFRRSELVALEVADIAFTRAGLVVLIRRSKTDQEGAGRPVGLPYGSNADTCPVRALQAWLESAGISEGPIFRAVNRHGQMQPGRLSDKAVALVVKRTAEAVGLDPERYAGHSLRAGLATSAAAAGASERSIMAQTGHKSVTMARRYIRDGSLFRENAAAQLGL